MTKVDEGFMVVAGGTSVFLSRSEAAELRDELVSLLGGSKSEATRLAAMQELAKRENSSGTCHSPIAGEVLLGSDAIKGQAT